MQILLIDKDFREAEKSSLPNAEFFECVYSLSGDFFTINWWELPHFYSYFHDVCLGIWTLISYYYIQILLFFTARGSARKVHFEDATTPQGRRDCRIMDYRTTMQRDYRPINPQPLKPVSFLIKLSYNISNIESKYN